MEEPHLLKHPVHNTVVEVNMFIEPGTEPVGESDCANPQPAVQHAIIDAVQRVTHIARPMTGTRSSARRWWRTALSTVQ